MIRIKSTPVLLTAETLKRDSASEAGGSTMVIEVGVTCDPGVSPNSYSQELAEMGPGIGSNVPEEMN
jgi:hypothetical protein